jgi:hypothetical protein
MQKCGIIRVKLQDKYSKLINTLTQQETMGIYYTWKNEIKVFLINIGELAIPHINNLKDFLSLEVDFYYSNCLKNFSNISIHNRLYPIPNRDIIKDSILYNKKYTIEDYQQTFFQYLQDLLNEKCTVDNYLNFFSAEVLSSNNKDSIIKNDVIKQQEKWGEIQLTSLFNYLMIENKNFIDDFLNIIIKQRILLNNLQEGNIDENIAQTYHINKHIIYVGEKGQYVKEKLSQFYEECNSNSNQIVNIDIFNEIVKDVNYNMEGYTKRLTLNTKNDIIIKQSTILANYGNTKMLNKYSKEKLKIILQYLQQNNLYINLQQEIIDLLFSKEETI